MIEPSPYQRMFRDCPAPPIKELEDIRRRLAELQNDVALLISTLGSPQK